MYCKKCGNEIKGNDNFCVKCGDKLDVNNNYEGINIKKNTVFLK